MRFIAFVISCVFFAGIALADDPRLEAMLERARENAAYNIGLAIAIGQICPRYEYNEIVGIAVAPILHLEHPPEDSMEVQAMVLQSVLELNRRDVDDVCAMGDQFFGPDGDVISNLLEAH